MDKCKPSTGNAADSRAATREELSHRRISHNAEDKPTYPQCTLYKFIDVFVNIEFEYIFMEDALIVSSLSELGVNLNRYQLLCPVSKDTLISTFPKRMLSKRYYHKVGQMIEEP